MLATFDPRRAAWLRPTEASDAPQALTLRQWQTLEAVQARLLPAAKGTPGASDVNAIGYLDAVLADPETEEQTVDRIRTGADRLDAFAGVRGARGYASLPPDAQDAGIRLFEGDWEGQLWLRAMLGFTLEAFLGDPLHGGNPDGRVWRWAGFSPGYPRPQPGWAPRGEGPERPR